MCSGVSGLFLPSLYFVTRTQVSRHQGAKWLLCTNCVLESSIGDDVFVAGAILNRFSFKFAMHAFKLAGAARDRKR